MSLSRLKKWHDALKKEVAVIEGSFNIKKLKFKDAWTSLYDWARPLVNHGKRNEHRQINPLLTGIRYVLLNGILINLIFYGLADHPINIPTIIGFGLAWWYFREELTEWIRTCRQ